MNAEEELFLRRWIGALRGFWDTDQLWDETYEYGNGYTEDRFEQAQKCMQPGLLHLSEHRNAADESGQLGRITEAKDLGDNHGECHAQTYGYRVRREKHAEHGAHDGTDSAAYYAGESCLPGLIGREIGHDDRRDQRVQWKLET